MLRIEHLTRTYGNFIAVDDVSFSIKKGEIVGLLGHNGAGKTTIMKMISGYLEPNNGRIEINGLDINEEREAVQKQLGYLPETLPVYPEMSVADYLDYAASLKGLRDNIARHEIRRVIQATDISDKLLSPIATLSRGYKQRVGVAQAILGEPNLLILDEPTNGLDPTQTQHMRELIRQIARDATVILSTHIMQEVDAICDRALIMRSGRLVVDAKLEDLRRSKNLLLHTDLGDEKFFSKMSSIEKVSPLSTDSGHLYQLILYPDFDAADVAAEVARNLIESGFSIYELKREQRDLEAVFREVNEMPLPEKEEAEVSHAA
jgi:ABC-2 type transport system ATP-binding protein